MTVIYLSVCVPVGVSVSLPPAEDACSAPPSVGIRTAGRRHANRRAARLAPRACFVRPRAVADSLAWWPHAARAALERAALDAGHVRLLVQGRAREEPAVPAARAYRQAGSAPEAGTRAPWSSNAARSKSHARVMVAHADWYAPAPVQILSASTDAAKKAELVSQRAALINEGKANPIASTRKEYLDMKARHCRPRRHRTPRTQSHAAAALSSQLSALSSQPQPHRHPRPHP